MTLRAPLSQSLTTYKPLLERAFATLSKNPAHYASIYLERKASQTASANLKQTQLSENASLGAVLRIYDGSTLFEEATDDLTPAGLDTAARQILARAESTSAAAGTRPYSAPTWKERLAAPLDREITEQIAAQAGKGVPSSEQWVHFGVRVQEDPLALSTEERVARVKQWVGRLKTESIKAGMSAGDMTYATARLGIATEEALFIDAQSRLSQTLYRISLTLIALSGAERTFIRAGGLGGMEAARVTDAELSRMLTDLKGLKSAERLPAGKYRIIFGPELTGVLAHEAFGHSQEADTCARGRSKAWELYKSGESVGNEHATILNNPAIYQNGAGDYAAWGSYFFDEEGWFAQEQVLLERGKLKAPMTNLTSALRLGVARTANGKRESWANGVYTRQTNTYFSPGDRTLDQMLQELGDGYIGFHPAGGMEDPKGMGIQVGISYLEEVKGGKRTGKLLRGPAGGDIQLTGYTPDVLNSIRSKSKIEAENAQPDRARHPFNDAGGCGKYHKEFVYAGCGGPFMLLEGVTLG